MIKNLATKIARYFTATCPESVEDGLTNAMGDLLAESDDMGPFDAALVAVAGQHTAWDFTRGHVAQPQVLTNDEALSYMASNGLI